MGDTEQNLSAGLLVLVLLQDSYCELLLVLGKPVLLGLGDVAVYFSLLKKLVRSPAGLITSQDNCGDLLHVLDELALLQLGDYAGCFSLLKK